MRHVGSVGWGTELLQTAAVVQCLQRKHWCRQYSVVATRVLSLKLHISYLDLCCLNAWTLFHFKVSLFVFKYMVVLSWKKEELMDFAPFLTAWLSQKSGPTSSTRRTITTSILIFSHLYRIQWLLATPPTPPTWNNPPLCPTILTHTLSSTFNSLQHDSVPGHLEPLTKLAGSLKMFPFWEEWCKRCMCSK